MINAVIATIVVSLVSLLGAVLMMKKKTISARYGSVMVSVAAGVMLATAILDLLPETLELNSGKEVYWVLLAGVCVFFVMERMMHWYHHHQHGDSHLTVKGHEKDVRPTAYLILAGDSLHNFFDGLAIATAFSVNFELGLVTTLAIMLHEIPQELADFVALVHSGMKQKTALFYNFLTAFTAILGAVLGWFFISSINGVLPYMLAFNAGMFIYISCSDLIPALHEDFKRDRKWLQTLAFLLGVALMGLLLGYLEHGPEDSTQSASVVQIIEIQKATGDTHLEAG